MSFFGMNEERKMKRPIYRGKMTPDEAKTSKAIMSSARLFTPRLFSARLFILQS